MKLKDYEIQVLEYMLKDKLDSVLWLNFLGNYQISDFQDNGSAGYYLTISANNLNLKKETIHKPTVTGENPNFMVGFLLFVNQNEVVLECHNDGSENATDTIRNQIIKIKID